MRKLIISILALAASTMVGVARTHGNEIVNLADSAEVYKVLYANTPIEPAFMLVPKFAIVGADGRFVFSTGASMRYTACYDIGNPVVDPFGLGVSELKPVSDGDRQLFQMSAGSSGIFFNIIGFPNTDNQVGLFISLGLDADGNNTYRVGAGQVYMRYRNMQCGYATSLYNDRQADAFTIDAHGPCASGAHNTVGVNWQKYINNHLRLGIGVEMPKTSYTQVIPLGMTPSEAALRYASSHQTHPDVPLYVGYNWDGGHVRISGAIRNIHYVDYSTSISHNVFGWGNKISGSNSFGPVKLYWMGQYGKGIASYFRDNSGAGLDLVPDDDYSGTLHTTRSWGCNLAMEYNYNKSLFSTVQYSYLRNYVPEYSVPATTSYNEQMRHGYSVTANLVWRLSSLFSIAIEYRYVHRTSEDRTVLSNNRIYAMMLMSF